MSAVELIETRPDDRVRRISGAVTTLRVLSTLNAVLVVLQPVWIGLYLDGRYGILVVHELAATGIFLVTLLQLLASIWFARITRRQRRVPLLITLLLLMVTAQTDFGYERFLGGHIPLGVATVIGVIAAAAWSWNRAGHAEPRPRRSALGPGVSSADSGELATPPDQPDPAAQPDPTAQTQPADRPQPAGGPPQPDPATPAGRADPAAFTKPAEPTDSATQ